MSLFFNHERDLRVIKGEEVERNTRVVRMTKTKPSFLEEDGFAVGRGSGFDPDKERNLVSSPWVLASKIWKSPVIVGSRCAPRLASKIQS